MTVESINIFFVTNIVIWSAMLSNLIRIHFFVDKEFKEYTKSDDEYKKEWSKDYFEKQYRSIKQLYLVAIVLIIVLFVQDYVNKNLLYITVDWPGLINKVKVFVYTLKP